MILKLQYSNLPYSLQQQISYTQIKRYVFFGSKLEKRFEKIIKKKLVGHSELLEIKKSREIAIQYGCANESELLERAKIIANIDHRFVPVPKNYFGNLAWQKPQFN